MIGLGTLEETTSFRKSEVCIRVDAIFNLSEKRLYDFMRNVSPRRSVVIRRDEEKGDTWDAEKCAEWYPNSVGPDCCRAWCYVGPECPDAYLAEVNYGAYWSYDGACPQLHILRRLLAHMLQRRQSMIAHARMWTTNRCGLL